MKKLSVAIALLALAACGKSDNDPGPGGVSIGEARALDEAAEMIEQRRLPSGAVAEPSGVASATTAAATP